MSTQPRSSPCNFCRSRKRRCMGGVPCTACTTHGKSICTFSSNVRKMKQIRNHDLCRSCSSTGASCSGGPPCDNCCQLELACEFEILSKAGDASLEQAVPRVCLAKPHTRSSSNVQHTVQPEAFDTIRRLRIFVPLLVPWNDRQLQLWFAVRVICIIIGSFIEVLIPHQVGLFMNNLSTQTQNSSLGLWVALDLFTNLAFGTLDRLSRSVITGFWYGELCKAALTHTLKLSLDFHNQHDEAEIQGVLEKVDGLMNLFATSFFELLPNILRLIMACVILYVKFGLFVTFLATAGSMIYMGVDVYVLIVNVSKPQRHRAQTELTRARHQALESHLHMKLFNMMCFHINHYKDAVDSLMETEACWAEASTRRSIILQIIQRGVFFAMSATLTQRGALTEDMVFLTMYWPDLAATLSRFPLQYGRMISYFADTNRLLAHFDTQPTVQDIKNAQAIADGDGHIEFNHVSFSYNSSGTVLRDICISIAPKTIVGLVGINGSGKSTILKLLPRLCDVDSGNIKVDGQDIKEVTQESLREAVLFLPSGDYPCQHRSIRQILEYAQPGIKDEQIFEACRAAKIHDDIWALPKKYDSVFGTELGLSDGQKQRIGIARAFIKAPRILVLDEPTSHLDPGNEAEILGALERLDCTIILSANRLSTVKQADQIVVLEEGRIIELGNHAELMKRPRGTYRKLCVG